MNLVMTHLERQASKHSRMSGFSLVELMISMTLGLATIAAIGWMYLGTTQTYRTQDSVARLQEGARYAFEVIGNDLRMAGATGCSYIDRANALNGTAWYTRLFEQPLVSLDETGTTGVTEFSDALRVVRADISREFLVQSHNSAGAQLTLSPHDLPAGSLLVATDCSHVALFQASAVTLTTVTHAAGGIPGNAVSALGTGGVIYTYTPGARVYRLNAATYYVANNPAGQPALFRERPIGAAATVTAEELVEGVEDFQVSFGVDTDTVADGEANFPYLTAAAVNSAAVPGTTAEERWNRVVSVRLSLLMRTVEDNVVPSAQSYSFNGANVVATDRRLRRVFTHVIQVRNR